jgi:hypothetical protein
LEKWEIYVVENNHISKEGLAAEQIYFFIRDFLKILLGNERIV